MAENDRAAVHHARNQLNLIAGACQLLQMHPERADHYTAIIRAAVAELDRHLAAEVAR